MTKVKTEAPLKTESNEFLDPFTPGVSYDEFLSAIPSGVTVEQYCEGNLTGEQIEWLVNDLSHYKK